MHLDPFFHFLGANLIDRFALFIKSRTLFHVKVGHVPPFHFYYFLLHLVYYTAGNKHSWLQRLFRLYFECYRDFIYDIIVKYGKKVRIIRIRCPVIIINIRIGCMVNGSVMVTSFPPLFFLNIFSCPFHEHLSSSFRIRALCCNLSPTHRFFVENRTG